MKASKHWKEFSAIVKDLALAKAIRKECKYMGILIVPSDAKERSEERARWKRARELTIPGDRVKLRKLVNLMAKEISKIPANASRS